MREREKGRKIGQRDQRTKRVREKKEKVYNVQL